MKRIIAALLCAALLCGSALAEPVPSKAVITIDNVRAAFFSPEGAYLSPMEQDGVLWVPAEALGVNLGMSVAANPDTLTVTVDGIQTAFFDEAGEYMSPLNVDGVVYIPLKAFAENVGIPLTVDGGSYTLQRLGEAAEAPAPEPSKAVPEDVWIDLTDENFRQYFSLEQFWSGLYRREQQYKLGDGYVTFQYWDVDVTLTCTARYGYPFRNVTFTAYVLPTDFVREYAGGKDAVFSDLTMPQSGELTRKVHLSNSYLFTMDYLNSTTLLFTGTDVYVRRGGSICVPRDSMLGEWASQYRKGEEALNSGDYETAVDLFTSLAAYEYEDAAEQAAQARELLNSEIDQTHKKAYDQALADLADGKFDAAIEALTALKGEKYADSDAMLEEAIRQRDDDQYARASDAVADEDFQRAIDLLEPLVKSGYEGASELLKTAKEGLQDQRYNSYEADYQAALKLEESLDFAAAIEAFKPLADADYQDSASHLEANNKAQGYLDERAAAYQAGIEAEGKSQWEAALDSFMSCLDYRNARAHTAVCLVNRGGCWITPPHNGGYYFVWPDEEGKLMPGYGNIKTGEFRFLTDVGIQAAQNTSDGWRQGLCVVNSGSGCGLMNDAGEQVLGCEWDGFEFVDGCVIARKGNEITFMNAQGQPILEGTYALFPTEGRAVTAKSSIYDNVKMTPVSCAPYGKLDRQVILFHDGRLVRAKQEGDVILSNDGKAYTVVAHNGGQALLDESGAELFAATQIFSAMGDVTTWECWHMYDGVIAYQEGDKWGLWDTVKNKALVKPTWDRVCPFTENGVARFVKGGKYGVVNAAGKTVLSARYRNMEAFYDGLARVSKSTRKKIDSKQTDVLLYGFVNEKGKEIVPVKYIRTGDFRQGFGLTWAWIDDGVLSGNHRMTQFTFHLLNKEGKSIQAIKDDASYSNVRECGIWFEKVYEVGSHNYISANRVITDAGESFGLCQHVWRVGDSLIGASFYTKEYGGYHYHVIDRNGRELFDVKQSREELTFGALSTDGGHLVWQIGGKNTQYKLFGANGQPWRSMAPEAQPEPTEAEIVQAAEYAGIR